MSVQEKCENDILYVRCYNYSMGLLKRQKLIKTIVNNPTISEQQAKEIAGYSPDTPMSSIFSAKHFQVYLERLDDRQIINKWFDWATREDMDKRVALEAGDKILKLKDRYPAGKLKIQAYNEELSRLQEDVVSVDGSPIMDISDVQ